jgi:uncharacterized OsmC-like protein
MSRRNGGASSPNGVDVGRLGDMADAMKAVPLLGKFTFRASNRWIRGGLNRSTLGDYRGAAAENHRERFEIECSQPALMFGGEEAPGPVDYLLHALAGCLTTAFVCQASLGGVRIQALASHVEADVDMRGLLGLCEEAACGFERVSVRLRIKADCPLQRLEELAAVARCRSPIASFIARAVPVAIACETD